MPGLFSCPVREEAKYSVINLISWCYVQKTYKKLFVKCCVYQKDN